MTSSVGMMLLRVDEQLKGEENGGNVGGPFSLDHRFAIFQEIVDNLFIQCGAPQL